MGEVESKKYPWYMTRWFALIVVGTVIFCVWCYYGLIPMVRTQSLKRDMQSYVKTTLIPKMKYVNEYSLSGKDDQKLTLSLSDNFDNLDLNSQNDLLNNWETDYDNELTKLQMKYHFWNTKDAEANVDLPSASIGVRTVHSTYRIDNLDDLTVNGHTYDDFNASSSSGSDSSSSNSYTPLTSLSESQKSQAWTLATHIVKQKLKSPSTASFPWYNDSYISLENGLIVVNAYVDAENGFGAKIRATFTVEFDANWNAVSVSISQ